MQNQHKIHVSGKILDSIQNRVSFEVREPRGIVSQGLVVYSHISNKRGGWNKCGGGAKFAKALNVEGGILWKKLMHNSNKRGVEGGKNLRNQ